MASYRPLCIAAASRKSLADIRGKPMVQASTRERNNPVLLTKSYCNRRRADRIGSEEIWGERCYDSAINSERGDRSRIRRPQPRRGYHRNVQGDEPLIEPAMIDQTIQLLIDDAAAVVGTAVEKINLLDELLTPNVVKS